MFSGVLVFRPKGADVARVGLGGGEMEMTLFGPGPLIGRPLSDVVLQSWGLGLLFFPLPVLVFFVFFELVSSSGYSSMRALLPERFDPFDSVSSFVRVPVHNGLLLVLLLGWGPRVLGVVGWY